MVMRLRWASIRTLLFAGAVVCLFTFYVLFSIIPFWNHKDAAQDFPALTRELEAARNENIRLKNLQNNNQSSKPCAKETASLVGRCQVIHVALICAGHNASRSVATLVKSLVFYRENPIHLHFIVDPSARGVLQTLFVTWDISHLNLSFYSADESTQEVAWIPNKHYSGLYGLLKLTLTTLLPQWLDRVIVLDTDLTFASDVANLWAVFDSFEPDQVVGLVENQSDWYLGKLFRNYEPWPALGRGFNTGVMAMDLAKMRKTNWAQLWRLAAEKELASHYFTSLADQDVINSVLFQNPKLVRTLPCQFNIQLSDNTRSELCYNGLRADSVQIVHWNSPKKLRVKNKHGDFFRNLFRTFLNFDGNLLRRQLIHCPTSGSSTTPEEPPQLDGEDDGCYDLRKAKEAKFRTHLYYLPYESAKVEDHQDVTWIAQLSIDRLQMIENLCRLWEGPVSLALYLSDAEAGQFEDFVAESECLPGRTNIGYHVVFKQGSLYPINHLRNVALDRAETPYVFLGDVDFLPMPDLYGALKKSAESLRLSSGLRALVVPAFETHRYQASVPRTKAELTAGLDQGDLFTFRYQDWPRGHKATNYAAWRTATKPYKVKWEPDYEPYVVVRRDVTRYDRRFVGFGWNKVSHLMELAAQKYDFIVLPNAFILHLPHSPSLDIAKYRRSAQYRKCSSAVKSQFARELSERYEGFDLPAQ